MTATLLDYAHTQFPGHEASVWEDPGSGLTLTDHTLVVHVVGVSDAAAVIEAAQQKVGDQHVAAVVVRRLDPSVLPKPEEDSDGLFDLPDRRLAVATILGGVVGLALGFGVGALLDGDSVWVTLISAAFIGVVGATLGFISGGGARHASHRSVSQPQAPGRDVAIVAAFLDDEATAVGLAHHISDLERQYDVRIVGADGAWHAPND